MIFKVKDNNSASSHNVVYDTKLSSPVYNSTTVAYGVHNSLNIPVSNYLSMFGDPLSFWRHRERGCGLWKDIHMQNSIDHMNNLVHLNFTNVHWEVSVNVFI